jgi:putative transposase
VPTQETVLGNGVQYLRCSVPEKPEIIRLIEQSLLSLQRILAQVGIPRSTFYLCFERYLERGGEALEDCQPAPHR